MKGLIIKNKIPQIDNESILLNLFVLTIKIVNNALSAVNGKYIKNMNKYPVRYARQAATVP